MMKKTFKFVPEELTSLKPDYGILIWKLFSSCNKKGNKKLFSCNSDSLTIQNFFLEILMI